MAFADTVIHIVLALPCRYNSICRWIPNFNWSPATSRDGYRGKQVRFRQCFNSRPGRIVPYSWIFSPYHRRRRFPFKAFVSFDYVVLSAVASRLPRIVRFLPSLRLLDKCRLNLPLKILNAAWSDKLASLVPTGG